MIGPVIITQVVNAEGRPFIVRLVRAGDHYGRDNRLTHDSAEPLIEFWDATYTHIPSDPFNVLGLGLFAARFGLGTLIGIDGYGHDYRRGSAAGLGLFDYMPDWKPTGTNVVAKVTSENVIEAIAAAEAALRQVPAAEAKAVRCARCDAGFLRVRGGDHQGCACSHLESIHEVYKEPCDRVFVVYDEAQESLEDRWLAYVDGNPLRKRDGAPRRYASASAAYEAACEAAPTREHNHPANTKWDRLRPPPRAGTGTALVLDILSSPRDFAWLTARDIMQIAAERGCTLQPGTVAAALSNLERDGSSLVDVDRTRKPFRYRRGKGQTKPVAAKLSAEMLTVLRQIAATSWGACGALGTRRALLRRGLVREVRDDAGRIHYEVTTTGDACLQEPAR